MGVFFFIRIIIINTMTKIPIYRVIKNTYYEQCDIKRTYYSVEYEQKILWWKIWRTLKELNCGWGDCHKSEMRFNSESDAIHAIKKLQNGNIPEGWIAEVSTTLDFNKGVGD